MKILYLGPLRQHMIEYLKSLGDEVVHSEKRLSVRSRILKDVDFIVSYGYQYIIREEILRLFPRRVVNLHISYLPYNRGKDPNMWSFLEDTPKGVTIHYIDPGIDTGDILAQKELTFDDHETLRTSYAKLSATIEELFMQIWPRVRVGDHPGSPQPSGGTFHYARDKREVEHLLTDGWDTPVRELIGRCRGGATGAASRDFKLTGARFNDAMPAGAEPEKETSR